MNERPHAEHRPPTDEDPSSVGQAAPVMLGQYYPLDDILAVIEDQTTAERAIEALKSAGVADGDVDLLDGAWFAEAMRATRQHHGIASRIASLLPTDESLLVKRYVEEAERGHFIVIVHAQHPEEIDRAREILAAHRAREMRHYGRRVITSL